MKLIFGILISTFCAYAVAGNDAPVNPYEGDAQRAEQGRSLFNQYCSHCHAPNAESPERGRDVRRLRRRYEDRMTEVFYKTVNEGRVDKGMPVWKGVIEEEVMWTIYTFVQSVQQ